MTKQYLYAGPCPNCKLPMQSLVRRVYPVIGNSRSIHGEQKKYYRHEDDKSPAHYEGCQRPRVRG